MSRQPVQSVEVERPLSHSSNQNLGTAASVGHSSGHPPHPAGTTSTGEPDFRRMVEGIRKDYFFYATDRDGNITYLSPSSEEILGYPHEQVLGLNWRQFVEANSPTLKSAESNEKLALDGQEAVGTLVEAVHADGSVRIIEAFPRAVFDEAGEVIGIEGICKDVTEIKRAEQELKKSSAELDQRVRERTAELRHRLEYEELLVSLSTAFVSTELDGRQSDAIGERLETALEEIGKFTGVDRCYIYKFSADCSTVSLAHEWCAPGVTSLKERLQNISVRSHKWPIERLNNRQGISVADTSQLPGDQADMQSVFGRLGISSMLNVPMHRGKQLIGTLGLSCHTQPRQWPQEDVDLLQVLSEVLLGAINRSDAETRLRESETRFRTVVQDQSDLIVRWKPDGTQTFVNQAVCRFMGKTEGEILRRSVYEDIHPEDREAVRNKVAALTQEKPYASDEHRVIQPDGKVAWMQWVDRALFDDRGQLVEFQSVGRDITALKNAQQELRRRLEFERLVLSLSLQFINMPLESIDDALVDALQRIGRFTGADRSFVTTADKEFKTAYMRYSWNNPDAPSISPEIRSLEIEDFPWAQETLSRGYSIHVPNLAELPPEASRLRQVLESIDVKSFLSVPLRAGERLIGHLGFLTFHEHRSWSNEDVSLLRVVGEVFVNALQRQEVETALHLSEERARLTIEGIEEGLYDWRVQTGEVYVSDYLLRSQGLPEGKNDHTFDKWFNRVHPEDKAKVRAALDRHLSGKTPLYEVEYRITHMDGSIRWGHARGRVIERDGEGNPTRLVGVDRDITDRVTQRRRMQELESQLVHLGRITTMGETVAGIAHEVNQPLHAAATFAAAARAALQSGRQGGVEKGIELTQKMSEQVTRAGDIIRRLREFTRPRPSDFERVNLNDIVRESAAFFSHITPGDGLRIEFDLDHNIALLQGDDIQLQQVLVNLFQNAYEAMLTSQRDAKRSKPEAGDQVKVPSVRITTRQWANSQEIRIADNGHPCPPDKLNHLFDAFFTTKAEGMGIGLALCHSIVQAHRGQIEALNNAEGGMTFVISFPTNQSIAKTISDGADITQSDLSEEDRYHG